MSPANGVAPPSPATESQDAAGRIVAAATQLFADRGFDPVSVQAVADAAGVCKANVFHHFGSKEGLYLAVLRRARDVADPHVDALEHGNGPIPTRLRAFLRAYLTGLFEQGAGTRVLLRELQDSGPERAAELAREVFGARFARFVEVLRAAQRRGELRATLDPAALAMTLVGAALVYFQSRAVLRFFPDAGWADDLDAYAGRVMDIVLDGAVDGRTA